MSAPEPTDPVVLHWVVPVDDQCHAIGGGRVLHVDSKQIGRPDEVHVWTLEIVDPTVPLARGRAAMSRVVRAFPTGYVFGGDVGEYLGTALAKGGGLVWHLFERRAS